MHQQAPPEDGKSKRAKEQKSKRAKEQAAGFPSSQFHISQHGCIEQESAKDRATWEYFLSINLLEKMRKQQLSMLRGIAMVLCGIVMVLCGIVNSNYHKPTINPLLKTFPTFKAILCTVECSMTAN